ncbi:MAG: hypothetical protein NTY08_19020 [Proteobacteria bacterium]|nr:hypothetical protein [Pseudomonadota bacterium]
MCPHCKDPKSHFVKDGFFPRAVGQIKRVQRYRCRACKRKFSSQTSALTYRERKPHLTQKIMRLLMEGISQRGCARSLRCTQTTVANKLVRLGARAQMHLSARSPDGIAKSAPIETVIFDEMETFEHSKCKPVAIAIAVNAANRCVIAAEVAVMPAKGKLAPIARKRYGKRQDDRPETMRRVLSEVHRLCPAVTLLKSDKCTRYPGYVKKIFGKQLKHETHKGRKGCVVGQGELKRGGRDPLFALNHTCAMFRDRIKRLSRRTWCTTKRVDRLGSLVHLYAWWHNQLILKAKNPLVMT